MTDKIRPLHEPDEPDAMPTVRSLVFQALGAASMCWENIEGAGVFRSERAAEIGEGLIEELRDLFGTEPL